MSVEKSFHYRCQEFVVLNVGGVLNLVKRTRI